jgi:dTDP-4-dehydrorhamnose 3,5-epimerase
MFEVIEKTLNGCLLLAPKVFNDHRGQFVKPYHWDSLQGLGIHLEVKEEIFSVSKKNVLRGMHFQTPPFDHQKFVYCVKGRILDVIVDIRKKSPYYGSCFSAELSSENRRILLVPRGFAHGFLSLEEDSTVVYKTDTVYAPEHDQGIRWDSFGFNWPVMDPVLSRRDQDAPKFNEFESLFLGPIEK